MSEQLKSPAKSKAKTREFSPGIKFAVEFGPLLAFFAVYYFRDIFSATLVFMVATAVSLSLSWIYVRRIAPMPLFTAAIIFVFGGLTLWLHDETFIKLKPTMVNLLFAGLLGGGLVFGRNPLKMLFATAFSLTDEGWRKLTLRWVFFFVLMAIGNEIVWRNFSTDIWVNYKVFGILPLTIIFAIAQTPLIQRHYLPEPD